MSDSTYVVRRKPDRTPVSLDVGPRLKQLDIELTERCNNRCIHCLINRPLSDSSAQADEMTTAQVVHILRQAAGLGCAQVRFTGGEPLIRTDFQDVYLYARRLGLKVSLFTNACFVTPDVARLFARVPPLVPIEITVYGMTRESYEAVTRSRGSHESFRKGLDELLACGAPFVVRWVVLPPNRHEIPEFEAWAKTLPGITAGPAYVLMLDHRSRRDDPEKNRVIDTLRLSPQETLAFLARDETKYRHGMAEFAARFLTPPGDRLFHCGAGHGVCIDAYGRVQPCMGVRDPALTFPLGFPEKTGSDGAQAETPAGPDSENGGLTLAQALDRFRRLKTLAAKHPLYLARCARCFLKGLCEQCPAKSWAEHGNLDTPVDYYCQAAHIQARYLGWLSENESGWDVVDGPERIKKWVHALSTEGNR
jgi:MoaA/NifB/PqqE/SkfB family radical SAM enzyme